MFVCLFVLFVCLFCLFLHAIKIGCHENTRLALEAEATKNFKKAQQLYADSISNGYYNSPSEQEFLDDAMGEFVCLCE